MANWLIVGGCPMYDVYRCSDCGYEAAESRTDHGIKQEMADFKHCPNCGKKFREVADGDSPIRQAARILNVHPTSE